MNIANKDNEIQFHIQNKFDFLIVGAGVSGLILADKLSEKYRVAIIESGDYSFDKRINEFNEINSIGHPMRADFFNRIRQFGGACNIWAGRCMPLDDVDFLYRPWIVDHGWPIAADEIEPYYKRLCREYDFVDYDCFKQVKKNKSSDFLTADIFEDSALHFIVAAWSKKTPRFGRGSELFSRLSKRKNLTLFLRSTVSDFISTEFETIGCNVVRFDGSRYKIRAQAYILATGGIENARVLLSSSTTIGGTLGNKFDHVGRYFMDHPTAVRSDLTLIKKLKPTSMFEYPTLFGRSKLGIKLSHSVQSKLNFTNPYIELSPKYPKAFEENFARFIEIYKCIKYGNTPKKYLFMDLKNFIQLPEIIYSLAPSEIFPHWFTLVNHKFSKFFGHSPGCTGLVLSHHLEQIPDRGSRVSLRNELNSIGIKKIDINWKINPREIESAEFLEWEFIKRMVSSGWISPDTEKSKLNIVKDASHHMGTTRMSNKYEDGVVDQNCKLHNNRNLYVIGSSVFPVSGHSNPTYTIGALSLRLADYLDREYENLLY